MANARRAVHIAGFLVRVGSKRRQLCAWCGVALVDLDLRSVAVPSGQDIEPRFFETGDLVEVVHAEGFRSQRLVPHVDGDPLPAGACALNLQVVRG